MKAYPPPLLMKERHSLPIILVIYHMTIDEDKVEAPFILVTHSLLHSYSVLHITCWLKIKVT